MYSCPSCGAGDVAGLAVCRCGADLLLLLRLDALADAWFNRGLEAAAAQCPAKALEWMAACCIARPSDAAAHRARGRLWAQLRRWEDAAEAFERAEELEPDSPDLLQARKALAAATRRRSRKKSVAAIKGDDQ